MLVTDCLFGIVVWHSIRSAILSANVRSVGSFKDAFLLRYDRSRDKDQRNLHHSRIGLVYATSMVAASLTVMRRSVPGWTHQIYHEGRIVVRDPGATHYLLVSAFTYFISDSIVIFDFPQYTYHHAIAIALVRIALVNPATQGPALCFRGGTEIGAVMLNVYALSRQLPAYIVFVASYFLSRVGLAVLVWLGRANIPLSMNVLCWTIIVQNMYFLSIHAAKFPRKLREYRMTIKD